MGDHIFSIVPVEAWMDKRLTLEQLRVLGVLFSFRSKNTDTVWPSRQQIAERCGMHVVNISGATSALERLGWLRKDGLGGYSKSTRYTIVVPEIANPLKVTTVAQPATVSVESTIAQSATVADATTVADSATGPLADSATRMPLADSATRKEHNQEQTNRTNHKNTRSKAAQLPDEINPQIADDFLELRRAKRAPLTQTALDGLVREAAKAGITLQAALETCCERGWTGFKSDWLKSSAPQQQRTDKFDPVAHVNRNRTRRGYEQRPSGNVIDITP